MKQACSVRPDATLQRMIRGGPANMLTLSCKSRLTCMPREAAWRLGRLTRSGGSQLQPA